MKKWSVFDPFSTTFKPDSVQPLRYPGLNPRNVIKSLKSGFFRVLVVKTMGQSVGRCQKWQNGEEQWLRVGVFWRLFSDKNLHFPGFELFPDLCQNHHFRFSKGVLSGQIWKTKQSSESPMWHENSSQLDTKFDISSSDHFSLGPLGHRQMIRHYFWWSKWQTQWH